MFGGSGYVKDASFVVVMPDMLTGNVGECRAASIEELLAAEEPRRLLRPAASRAAVRLDPGERCIR